MKAGIAPHTNVRKISTKYHYDGVPYFHTVTANTWIPFAAQLQLSSRYLYNKRC